MGQPMWRYAINKRPFWAETPEPQDAVLVDMVRDADAEANDLDDLRVRVASLGTTEQFDQRSGEAPETVEREFFRRPERMRKRNTRGRAPWNVERSPDGLGETPRDVAGTGEEQPGGPMGRELRPELRTIDLEVS